MERDTGNLTTAQPEARKSNPKKSAGPRPGRQEALAIEKKILNRRNELKEFVVNTGLNRKYLSKTNSFLPGKNGDLGQKAEFQAEYRISHHEGDGRGPNPAFSAPVSKRRNAVRNPD